jgi:hypothetical protein
MRYADAMRLVEKGMAEDLDAKQRVPTLVQRMDSARKAQLDTQNKAAEEHANKSDAPVQTKRRKRKARR